MAHIHRDQKKLLNRVRRIRGQVEALERMLGGGPEGCSELLSLITAARGAMNALMFEVLEGHVQSHVLSPTAKPGSPESEAAAELVDVIRSYLK
ncbi:MAG TPA: metal/formaldehyde-sensitive transcriptional repressor [Holophagaceae bacterium]|nr:metal/formaldehyde-sensitive transcriptional repressor [Holophagaceae bacterium]